ncbi:BTB/POZ fold domain and BTB/Kelch-associated domain-containing protein [Strongyloides ratti]|uniref:BTB/POZ fold domain and BTB/Kelch-associated domain-containing protein n=1 Tax=Strongyloides ratti TaxID=34506 RepID=A0A090L7I1_STRRB|nr:BTB/POZ fold domain and BTB/Kelch-associated domain-containing protein [Strongyloides ratti]CEF64093.1 BTB/POZ fold domain and BTB/Kelch-associated domain-containing protein [Strongyloides ratti]
MVFKRFVSGPLTNHSTDYENENEKDKVNMKDVTSIEMEDSNIAISYDKNTKYYEIKFEKQKKLAKDIENYIKTANCPSYVSIQLKNSENVKIPSLLFSYASCLIERIISQKKSFIYFIKAKEFGEKQMKMILNFIMTGELNFYFSDFTELLSIAHRFEMFSICTILETSMLTSLKSNKSLLPILLNFASEYKILISTKTRTHLLEMVNHYFNDFVKCQHYLKLTPQALVMVMSSNVLKVMTEMTIFRMGIIYMCKKEMYGFADSIFNCIRFEFCNKETIKKMKLEVEKLNRKYLSYVFESFYKEIEDKNKEFNNQIYGYNFQKNFNRLSPRNIDIPISLTAYNFLETTIQNMIKSFEIKNNNTKVFNIDNYGIKKNIVKIKSPKQFNLYLSEPKFLKKIKSNKMKNLNDTKIVEVDNLISMNPYQHIQNFNNRLFSSDSVYEINKFKNYFYDGDKCSNVIMKNVTENNNIKNDEIEINPYYYSYIDRVNRKYTVDSICDINQLSSYYDINQQLNLVGNSNYKINQPNFAPSNLEEYLTNVHTPK